MCQEPILSILYNNIIRTKIKCLFKDMSSYRFIVFKTKCIKPLCFNKHLYKFNNLIVFFNLMLFFFYIFTNKLLRLSYSQKIFKMN